jgi:hypothetical protein
MEICRYMLFGERACDQPAVFNTIPQWYLCENHQQAWWDWDEKIDAQRFHFELGHIYVPWTKTFYMWPEKDDD